MAILPAIAQAQQLPSFKTGRTVVLTRVYVHDEATGQPVEGLQSSDFLVTDHSREVPVLVEEVEAPIRMAVVVQHDRGSASALVRLRETGANVAATIAGDGAKVAVVSYASSPELLHPFSDRETDLAPIFRGILSKGDGNSLLDALAFAAGLFPPSDTPETRIVMLFGESRDRGSTQTFEEVRALFLQKGIALYLLAYANVLQPFVTRPVFECPKPICREEEKVRVPPAAARHYLAELKTRLSRDTARVLAAETGGLSVSFLSKRGLDAALGRLSAAIHRGYLLSFSPATPSTDAPALRDLSIVLRRPGKYTLLYRRQYYLGQ